MFHFRMPYYTLQSFLVTKKKTIPFQHQIKIKCFGILKNFANFTGKHLCFLLEVEKYINEPPFKKWI